MRRSPTRVNNPENDDPAILEPVEATGDRSLLHPVRQCPRSRKASCSLRESHVGGPRGVGHLGAQCRPVQAHDARQMVRPSHLREPEHSGSTFWTPTPEAPVEYVPCGQGSWFGDAEAHIGSRLPRSGAASGLVMLE